MRTPIFLICCLLLALCWPAAVLAAPPVASGADQCLDCHETETATWMDSPHANAAAAGEIAATCEGCHGSYVEDHPQAGIMKLTLDSSVCVDCHSGTVDQWENTVHAEAGVDCVGCHLSHSQEFRMTDENRCGSCHREVEETLTHSAHGLAEVDCTDCHVNPMPAPANENLSFISDSPRPAALAPDHDFTHVANANCLSCHTEDAHSGLPPVEGERVALARLVSQAESAPVLAAKLEASEQANQSLMIIAPLSLGFGVSLGIALVGVLVMVYCYVNRRESIL